MYFQRHTWSTLHPRYPRIHLLGTPRCLQATMGPLETNDLFQVVSFSYLKVHIAINRHEITFVLATPFELDNDGFAGQFIQEWLWVGGYKLENVLWVKEYGSKHYDATYGCHSIRITRWIPVRRREDSIFLFGSRLPNSVIGQIVSRLFCHHTLLVVDHGME